MSNAPLAQLETLLGIYLPTIVINYLHYVILIVGFLLLLKYVLDLLQGIYARLLRPGKNLVKQGKWAVVTGATDGIGYAMCEEFARKGLNVVLISRTLDNLNTKAKELSEKYPKIQTKVLDIDYSRFDENAQGRVGNLLTLLAADGGISTLVNNVGISYPYTKYFHELDDERVTQLIKINIDSTTYMTRLVLPYMLEARKGNIVNISSAAGVSTSPLLAQYGAAKSYIAMFSRALNYELRDKGIHVQCQVPMFVATKLAKIKRASLFVASPKGYARSAVAAIGYEILVSPFWTHALQIWVLTNFPEWLIAAGTNMMHKGIRAAGMKKDARKQKEN